LTVLEELKQLASVDLFTEGRNDGTFVGRSSYLDFERVRLLFND
jgi:hypothetical protein